MRCQHCKTEGLRKFSIICQEGTSSATSRATVHIRGAANGERIYSSTTAQTQIARNCNPPQPPMAGVLRWVGMIAGILACMTVASMFSLVGFFWIPFLILVIPTSIYLHKTLFARMNAYNATYEERLREWNISWLCMTCGETSLIQK